MSGFPKQVAFVSFFLAGVAVVVGIRIARTRTAQPPTFTPSRSTFSLAPPSEALSGTLTSTIGSVEKQPRDKEDFEQVSEGEVVLQGEALRTAAGSSATLLFSDISEISLGPHAQVGLISLLPESFLIHQTSGTVTYEIIGDISFSVRSLHTLIQLQPGEGQMKVEGKLITLEIFSGGAKLALVDLENQTRVWSIEEGQKATINDAEGSVETTLL